MAMIHALKSWYALKYGASFGSGNEDLFLPIFSDVCVMSLAITDCLEKNGRIIQDQLAGRLAQYYVDFTSQGYSPTTAKLLTDIYQEGDWQEKTKHTWPGGSYGSAAAARSAPIGAFYADEVMVIEQARLSAVVTHSHVEAIAGTIAVSLAASNITHGSWSWPGLINELPNSIVRNKLNDAARMSKFTHDDVAISLGDGSQYTAMDTVPYCLWAAHQALSDNDFSLTMKKVASVGGDSQTNCAIVAGILGNRIPMNS